MRPIDRAVQIEGRRIGAAELARAWAKTEGTVWNKLSPKTESHQLTVHELISLVTVFGGTSALHALNQECGFVAVPVEPLAGAADLELLDLFAVRNEKLGATATAIRTALEDGQIDADEYAHIEQCVNDEFRAALELMSRLGSLRQQGAA